MTVFPSHCYQSQLYVYDWEANGTVGTLPIPVETMLSAGASEACETTTPAPGNVTDPGVCLCISIRIIESDLCDCRMCALIIGFTIFVHAHTHTLVTIIRRK